MLTMLIFLGSRKVYTKVMSNERPDEFIIPSIDPTDTEHSDYTPDIQVHAASSEPIKEFPLNPDATRSELSPQDVANAQSRLAMPKDQIAEDALVENKDSAS